jgi:hypothetical protein
MSEREIVISLDELNRLEIYCLACNAGISIDVASDSIPSDCPACRKDFPHVLNQAVKGYRKFFTELRELNNEQGKPLLKFRMKEP